MLGWLFVCVLGIIWLAFLLPYGLWSSVRTSSTEEFERKLDLLAETNGRTPGRWVLIPRKGERFHAVRDRTRIRVRRRRRQVLSFLIELTLLTLVIGLFPPLHRVLNVALALGLVLLVYVVALMRIRTIEMDRARHLRVRQARAATKAEASAGRGPSAAPVAPTAEEVRFLQESGLRLLQDESRITDDDVHVVVHRSDEVDLEELHSAAH